MKIKLLLANIIMMFTAQTLFAEDIYQTKEMTVYSGKIESDAAIGGINFR